LANLRRRCQWISLSVSNGRVKSPSISFRRSIKALHWAIRWTVVSSSSWQRGQPESCHIPIIQRYCVLMEVIFSSVCLMESVFFVNFSGSALSFTLLSHLCQNLHKLYYALTGNCFFFIFRVFTFLKTWKYHGIFHCQGNTQSWPKDGKFQESIVMKNYVWGNTSVK